MSRAFIPTARFAWVTVCVCVAFGVILARLFFLHIWDQGRLLQIVERNRQKFEVIAASRGDVVDARGNVLATTRSVVELGVDPQSVREADLGKLSELAQMLKLPLGEVEQKVTTKIRYVDGPDGSEIRKVYWRELADGLDEGTYQKVLDLGIKGVYGNRKYERVYPSGSQAAHVLGFVNKEGSAVMGVEQKMDFYLRGQNGWRESERDGGRRELPQFRSREVEPTDGLHVELTIDSMVQHIIEQELVRINQEFTPEYATIIVSEPSTGFILGLANTPAFNPNEFWKAPMDAHRNRAITDVYEPGSTFKMVPFGGAINEQVVRLDDEIDCSVSTVEYRGQPVKLPKDHKPMDTLSVHDVIVRSSNRGVAQIAMKLGSERLYDYAQAFGFGEKTGFLGVGEVSGTLHPLRAWDRLTISRMPMGHAVSATPMQVHYSTSVVANQGILMEPRIVRRVFDEANETVIDFSPHPKRRVMSGAAASTVAGVLAKVGSASKNTGKNSTKGYQFAGKSGTSQKIINGRYSRQHHVASFSGFFPANQPRFVITVVIDDPKCTGTGYGSRVAAPAFRNVAQELIRYYGIQPEPETEKLFAWKGWNHDRI